MKINEKAYFKIYLHNFLSVIDNGGKAKSVTDIALTRGSTKLSNKLY